jgi:chromosomal replication initiation ATPase DnaA
MEGSYARGRWPSATEPLRAGMSQLVVAHAYSLRVEDLRAPSRTGGKVAQARQVAMYLAHVVFSMSVSAVARAFGRDRATARHAIIRVELLRDDPELDRTLGWLEATLRVMADRS